MKKEFEFFRTTMPDTRKADYYLGCLDSSVFIDFTLDDENRMSLTRMSFDGYGCCTVEPNSIALNRTDSKNFELELKKEPLNQYAIRDCVLTSIHLNKEFLWEDVLEEYGFLAP